MIRLKQTLAAWGTEAFRQALKEEIGALDARLLPLQEALSRGSHSLEGRHEAVLIGAADLGATLRAKVGLFFTSIIAGCSCADDPTPRNEETEYCVLQVDIDKRTAEATVALLPE